MSMGSKGISEIEIFKNNYLMEKETVHILSMYRMVISDILYAISNKMGCMPLSNWLQCFNAPIGYTESFSKEQEEMIIKMKDELRLLVKTSGYSFEDEKGFYQKAV